MSAAEALAPEQSVDEVRESLSVTEKGQPANTIGNCRTVFCHDPLLRGAIRLNLLTDRVDIVRDLGWRRNTSALTDTDVKYLLLYFEQNYGLTSEKKMTAALSIVANENCYHPIQDVLNGLVWDGTPRIRSCLHHFLGADESDYVEEMLKHFLLGAIRDEWFSDDLKKLDDDRVYLKLQGHWIIEMSEMLATSSAKSIEEIRSFISRQKETYRTPYEAQPKDRLRQCVFGGSSNTLDFLPLDRAGNRRFLPIMIYPENAEVHILEDEDASRAYLLQVWAEAMTIYRSGHYSMKFSKSIQRQLVEVQKDFMPEDTEAGQIQGFLEHYTGSMVCSKQLFKEALGHTYDEPKRWQLHNINEIMNTVVTGWKPFSNPRMFAGYGRQRGWERDVSGNEDGFVELSEEECRQLELPKEWIA
ncbi:VapE domain-containing protein [Pusillibacter faecalis]|nr:VapE domain-containing protein [Pusillibacter faecalis]